MAAAKKSAAPGKPESEKQPESLDNDSKDFDALMAEEQQDSDVDEQKTSELFTSDPKETIEAAELPEGQTVTNASKGNVETSADVAAGTVQQHKSLESDKKIDLFDANEGQFQRDGGPYLDQVDRVRDERIRAAKEGREPDLDNPPISVGTPLVHERVLVEKDVQRNHGVPWGAESNTKPLETVKIEDYTNVAPVEGQESDHDAGPYGVETGPYGPGTPVETDDSKSEIPDRTAKMQESKSIEQAQAKADTGDQIANSPTSKPA